MRINKYIALATGISRRAADQHVLAGSVTLNGTAAQPSDQVADGDVVMLAGKPLRVEAPLRTIIFNKPIGYVVSRDGQGSKTVYDLLPADCQQLKPVGRLDKDSSGLLLLTNDGKLANELTHPSRQKIKRYHIRLDAPLQPLHRQMISDFGLRLEDGISRLQLERTTEGDDTRWTVIMHEGRNRQIRRTFASVGYTVTALHRTHFGPYSLGTIKPGSFAEVSQP
jgi:23S rRNA pseudouridine2605 synthase